MVVVRLMYGETGITGPALGVEAASFRHAGRGGSYIGTAEHTAQYYPSVPSNVQVWYY